MNGSFLARLGSSSLMEDSLLSQKITLSPRGGVNNNFDFFSAEEFLGEVLEKPIIMQEEILLDENKSSSYCHMENEDQAIVIPKHNKKKRNAIPGKSFELKGVDNSKSVTSGQETIEKIKRKHNFTKNNSPVRTRILPQVPPESTIQFMSSTPIVHVPLGEFSATRLEVHLPHSITQKIKPAQYQHNNEMISIEVVKDMYSPCMEEQNYDDDNNIININFTTDDRSVSSDSDGGDGRFDIIKSKVSFQPDYSAVKMETKQIMEEEIKTMKNSKKKVPSIATQQLDFFKKKSRDVLSDSTINSSFKKKINSGVKRKVNSILNTTTTTTSDDDEEDIEQKEQFSQLSIKLPFLDKRKLKRKTTIDFVEKVSKPVLTASSSVQSFSEFEEVDFFDGNEDMGIVDDVIKAASARGCSNLPKTKIPKKYHIIETTPIATRDELGKNSQYNIEKKLWETTIFPSNKPTSRIEVVQLARTFEQMLSEMKEKKKDELFEVTEEVMILDVIASEISRQISGQCAERGILLEKLISRFKRLTIKSTKISKEAASKLDDIQARERQVNSMVDFYTDLAKSKEELLAKKEEEMAEMLEQIDRLKSQLRQTKKGIHSMTTEYFQERIRQEMVSKSLQTTPRENPNNTTTTTVIMEPSITIPTPPNQMLIEEELKIRSLLERQKIQMEEKSVNTPTIEGISLDSVKEIERFNSLFVKPKIEEEVDTSIVMAASEESKITQETQTEMAIQTQSELSKIPIVPSPRTAYKTMYKQGIIKDKAVQVITATKVTTPPPPVVQDKPIPVSVSTISTQTFLAGDVIKPPPLEHDVNSDLERNTSAHVDRSVSPPLMSALDSDIIKKRIEVNSQPESRNSKRDSVDFLKYKMKLVKPDDIYNLFRDILSSDKKIRKQSLRWMNKMILDIFLELSANDFLFLNNELVLIRKFVYDFFLLKFGLPTIALNHLTEFLINIKSKYRESIRVQMFTQYCILSEWIGRSVLPEYTIPTLQFYLKVLTFTRGVLNKRALRELEDGSLFVSLSFVNNLMERMQLPLQMDELQEFIIQLKEQSEDNFVYFDYLLKLLVELYHNKVIVKKHKLVPPHLDNATTTTTTRQQTSKPPQNQQISITISSFKKMLKTYFKKLYIVKDRITGPNEFITRNEKIAKSNLLTVYHQTTAVFHELIEKRVKEEERSRVLQLHNSLWSTLERQNLEDGMNSYRAFIIDALTSVQDETFKVFAIMIQKLVPVVVGKS